MHCSLNSAVCLNTLQVRLAIVFRLTGKFKWKGGETYEV